MKPLGLQFLLQLQPGLQFKPPDEESVAVNRAESAWGLKNLYLHYLCRSLQKTTSTTFRVLGFDPKGIFTDVCTEFYITLEHFPHTRASAKAFQPFQIDFFEQGVDATLRFEPSGEIYEVHWTHFLEGTLHPATEIITPANLISQLQLIETDLLDYLGKECPALYPEMLKFFQIAPDAAEPYLAEIYEKEFKLG